MATESTNVNGRGKETAKSGEPSLGDLQAQLDLLREEIGRLTSLTSDVTKAEAARAKEALKAKGEEYRAAGEAHYQELRRTAEGHADDAVRYVKEQPLNALGIAAGLGFVVGFLLSQRR